MSRYVLPAFDPQAKTSGTFPMPTADYTGKLIIKNESPVNLIITMNNDQVRVSAWTADRIDVTEICKNIGWAQEAILSNAATSPISKVLVDVYDLTDKVSAAYPVALFRNANVGNTVSTSTAQAVINDGSAANTVVVESTPTGQVQSALFFDNSGNVTLRTLDNNVWSVVFQLVANASGAATKLFHGTADAANSVPATGVTAGALPAGVTLPATQLSAGALPAGVTLPATQLSAGALPAGVTLPASQLSAGTVPAGVVVDGSLITTGTIAAARVGVGYNAASLGGTNLAPGVAVLAAQVGNGYLASQLANGTFAAGVQFYHVYNVYDFGATGNGSTDDTTAIQGAINTAAGTGGAVFFPYGNYLITTPLTLSSAYNNVALIGQGRGATSINCKVGAGAFVGAAMLYWQGGGAGINRLTVKDLRFYGGSGTTSTNPAADAIQLNSSVQYTLLDGVQFDNINGYAVQVIAGSSGNIGYTQLANCLALHCSYGYRFVSTVPASNRVGLITMSNCVAQDCQVGDALDLEEVIDVTVDNFQGFTTSNTGASVHIKGCSFVYLSNIDTNTSTTHTSASWLLEAGSSHSNDHIFIDNSLITKGTPGMSIQATTHLHLSNCEFISNQSHGVTIIDDTANGPMYFTNCFFNQNNRGSNASTYDFNNGSSHGKVMLNSCNFESTIGATGTNLAAAISTPDNFTGFKTDACNFSGGHPVFSTALVAPKKAEIRSCKGFNPTGTSLATPAAPTLSAPGSGSTLTPGTFQVEVTYTNALGETVASAASSQVIAAGQNLQINSPAANAAATGWNAYVTQSGGVTFTLQQATPTAIGTNLTLTANPTSTGAAPPTSNNSGVVAPTVPATTVALQNDRGVDCMVLVAGGTVSNIALGGTNTGQTSGWFRVPALQTITLTYTVAPTWTWWGD